VYRISTSLILNLSSIWQNEKKILISVLRSSEGAKLYLISKPKNKKLSLGQQLGLIQKVKKFLKSITSASLEIIEGSPYEPKQRFRHSSKQPEIRSLVVVNNLSSFIIHY